VLQLRVFGAGAPMASVAEALRGLPGVLHITRVPAGDRSGRGLVTADLRPDAVDPALSAG
jgi:hypothetical protein